MACLLERSLYGPQSGCRGGVLTVFNGCMQNVSTLMDMANPRGIAS